MENYEFLVVLSLFTIGIALAFAIWQRYRVKRAKQTVEHSELTATPREVGRGGE